MKAILGRKLRMTRVYNDEGHVIPLTLIQAGPSEVARVKTDETDGYAAVQMAFESKKRGEKESPRVLREVRLAEGEEAPETGSSVTVDVFAVGDTVKVTGTSKGRGYAGVVKRHGFSGSPKTHGHKHDHRAPGSIGAAFPQHVMKGVKMAGRMGGVKNTVRGLEVVVVDPKEHLLGVKGSVPGAPGSLVYVELIAPASNKKNDE